MMTLGEVQNLQRRRYDENQEGKSRKKEKTEVEGGGGDASRQEGGRGEASRQAANVFGDVINDPQKFKSEYNVEFDKVAFDVGFLEEVF